MKIVRNRIVGLCISQPPKLVKNVHISAKNNISSRTYNLTYHWGGYEPSSPGKLKSSMYLYIAGFTKIAAQLKSLKI